MTDFVHPGESSALNKLMQNKVFQYVADIFQTVYTDLTSFAAMKGRNFLVTEATMPELYALYQTAGGRLGLKELPPLYIQHEYTLKIRTAGTDGDCAVVMDSACLEECSREQLLALLGQELTHVRCRHLRILNMDSMVDTLLARVPMVGPAAAQTMKTLLLQWKEYAFYTADRGAAIAAGAKLPVYQNLTHAMGMRLDQVQVDALLSRKEDPQQLPPGQGAAAKVVLQMMIGGIAVPFGMWRLRELRDWEADPGSFREDAEGVRVEMEGFTRLTVNTVDMAAKGIYRGAVFTAGAVKTGKEELEAYVEVNRPVWESNMAQAREKTAEAVRTGKQEVSAYLKEKSPEWKENLANARSSAASALQTGGRELASRLSQLRDKRKDKRK